MKDYSTSHRDSQGFTARPMTQAEWDAYADAWIGTKHRENCTDGECCPDWTELDQAQHGTQARKAAAIAAEATAQARANQENPWEDPPMSPEEEEQLGLF